MKIITLDTDDYVGFKCPGSELPIGFYPEPNDEDFLIDPDDINASTCVRGILVDEVGGEEIMTHDESLQELWGREWKKASDEADKNDDWLGLSGFLSNIEIEDLIAIEVTTHGIACGPVSMTVYYLMSESDWEKTVLVPA